MTQLGLLDAGPGWYSVRVQHADGNGEQGWCRYYESEADALHAGESKPAALRGGHVTITPWEGGIPKFAQDRWDEWNAAAEGVPLSVDEYGRVRNRETNRRHQA